MLGVSAIVELLLITLLLISLVSLLWFFTSGTVNAIARSGTNQTQRTQEIFSTCMIVDSIHGSTIYLKNCGYGVITNSSLGIYLDDTPLRYTMTPQTIGKGGVGTITANLSGVSVGDHVIKITNPNAQTVQSVGADYSCSLDPNCVLDLEFDEGSGTIAYDSSQYGNNANVIGMIDWSDGKDNSNGMRIDPALSNDCQNQGSAIEVTTIPEYMKELTWKQFTITMWVKYDASRAGTLFHLSTNQSSAGFNGLYLFTSRNDGITTDINVANDTRNNTRITFNDNLPFQQWHQVAYVFDNLISHSHSFYADGVQQTTGNLYGNYGDVTGIYFGVYELDCEDATSGNYLDEIRIYNRSLTSKEINGNYVNILKMK
jgi:hypothetical protein